MELSGDINKDILNIKRSFHSADDLKLSEFVLRSGARIAVFFIEGASDLKNQRDVLNNLLESDIRKVTAQSLMASILAACGLSAVKGIQECLDVILRGDTLILIDGDTEAIAFATAKWEGRSVAEPPTSSILRGPREGFTENIKINLTLLRRRLKTPDLMFDSVKIGRYSSTQVSVCYISSIADDNIVRKVKERIKVIDIDGIIDSYYIEEAISEHKYSPMAQVGISEKPDIVCAKLLEGRVAILVDGSPIALTLPFLFFENIQESGDYYNNPTHANFLRMLRVFALLVGIFLPGVYVTLQLFHFVMLPQEFLLNLMNSVQGLPMTPLLEMVFVLMLFEIIHEASLRMPRYVGMAMSIVGALVLGDTAVKAGLISTPSIMIVALSSISLYTVPDQVGTFKMLRMINVLISGVAGLLGTILFFITLLVYLCNMDSYGTPYLAPYAPLIRDDLKDGIIKDRMIASRLRPLSIPNKNRVRRKVSDE